jgi:cytochrome c-type biogenesis protein CcmH
MKFAILAVAIALATPAGANVARPNADDPLIEQRMNALAEDLRCLVCQNESLAGSRAALAEDLRREIRAQMKSGKSDAEVVDYLTTRYGDFVLYRPPFKPVTYVLWLGPLLFVAIGTGVAYAALRRRRDMQETDTSSGSGAAALLGRGTPPDA